MLSVDVNWLFANFNPESKFVYWPVPSIADIFVFSADTSFVKSQTFCASASVPVTKYPFASFVVPVENVTTPIFNEVGFAFNKLYTNLFAEFSTKSFLVVVPLTIWSILLELSITNIISPDGIIDFAALFTFNCNVT